MLDAFLSDPLWPALAWEVAGPAAAGGVTVAMLFSSWEGPAPEPVAALVGGVLVRSSPAAMPGVRPH